MAIRILDRNGTARHLSEGMRSAFRSELRRIGEAPSDTTVNLWISDQTPEQLLETLSRIPARPIATGEQQHGTRVPDSQQIPAPENTSTAAPSHASRHAILAPATRVQNHNPSNRPASPPRRSDYALAVEELSKPGRVYNSAYQRETGHIFVDPCGTGEHVSLADGRVVNLREEWMKEREREMKKRRGNGGGNEGR